MRILTLTFALASAALPALAEPLAQEPHLNVIARSQTEADRIARVVAPTTDFTKPEMFEGKPAGAATALVPPDRGAFSQPSANLDGLDALDFELGDGMFRKLWASSPSSTLASDGLGPLYNARSCQRCHINDGRGHAPDGPTDNRISMIAKLAVPVVTDTQRTKLQTYLATQGGAQKVFAPHPVYGAQLQDASVQGFQIEGRLAITYAEVMVALSGGETARLRKPTYRAADLRFGALGTDTRLSPRVAPQMIGLGLIEAIPATDILANADPDDLDNDGISGRAQVSWSVEFQQLMLGRFGLKASAPTVRQQSAAAFSSDIGISSPLFPAPAGDCTETQERCLSGPHGDGDVRVFEVDDIGLDLTAHYSRNLAVPARRDLADPEVLRGKAVFYETGCIACHRPKFVTHRLQDRSAQSFQLIWPYSDFLLHDMGEGLADNLPEGTATGREWRTPPLWGIGLTQAVSGHTHFLHDGRARSLLEAILWHGGEAQTQRDRVVTMPLQERAALLRFLESL